jgi:hypothetical protein
MNTDGDQELGRPRYQTGPGEQAPSGRPGLPGTPPGVGLPGAPLPGAGLPGTGLPGSPAVVNKTAPSAVAAMAFAAIGWLLPVFGGVIAIRRARVALREIAASDGELDGIPLAVWARRLGWCYVVVWSVVLFYLALQLYVEITNAIITVK